MFAQAHTPEQLTLQELDAYLKRGWFRMGPRIFTTNFVHFKDQIYSTVWLRILLNEYEADSTQTKLFKRNTAFRTTIKPLEITEEKEELYVRYKQSLPFQPSDSIHQLLMGRITSHSIYNTLEVNVRDGDKLIACGFFDLGETSAMGISSIYDPAYKKYSLGKYLIYTKIQYCQNLKLRYFYPGYFVPGYSFFDYKLTIGRSALEFLQLSSQQWFHIDTFSDDDIAHQVMFSKLLHVHEILAKENLKTRVVKYEFFDANLIPDLRDAELLDFPVMLFRLNAPEESTNNIIVFDVRDGHYHLLSCLPIWKPNETNPDPTFYSDYFLKAVYEMYETPIAGEMADVYLKLSMSTS